MKNSGSNQKNAPKVFLVQSLREELRLHAVRQAEKVARSVGRRTSYDAKPCEDYREEVLAEYGRVDGLLYVQNCRSAVERCIAGKHVRMRYQWMDGRVTITRFRRLPNGRIAAWGLQLPCA